MYAPLLAARSVGIGISVVPGGYGKKQDRRGCRTGPGSVNRVAPEARPPAGNGDGEPTTGSVVR